MATKKVIKVPVRGNERARVVVKLRSGVDIPPDANVAEFLEKTNVLPLSRLGVKFGKLPMQRAIREPKRVQELQQRAMQIDPTYRPANLQAYVYIDVPPGADPEAMARELMSLPDVELAYVDRPAPDPLVNAANDPRSASQGYLDPSPDGIDAEYAWGFSGGDGAGLKFIDLEQGWTLNHEDLVAHGASMVGGVLLDSSRHHGTAVLGEVCASDNTLGCVGIVPNVDVDVVSYNGSTRVEAIITAIANLSFGDVLLIEAQVWAEWPGLLLGPIETYDAEFDALRLATALGIVVVEAGGNGTNNGSAPPMAMDTWVDPFGRQIFNPGSPDFRDSGAIIVTAASSAAPHTRLAYGPHGARIDCYAWGQNIETCGSNNAGATNLYTSSFGGTSGASPIITGAALAVQAMNQDAHGFRFNPKQLRAILRNPANGTPPSAAEVTAMGVMPNLRTITDNILNIAPDVYIRDFVGDSGEPHAGSISASPDIIVRPTAVANPQAEFGAGSGTENSSTLGYIVEAGQPNFIYVRVLNQGGAAATNVTVTVYWSPVSTLVTPNLWTLVGSVNIPSVPTGSVLTVSNAITWAAANIPAVGHYCLVGIIGTANDPAPSPGDLLNWDNFQRFIRDNNNVTWRNFNVVDNEPSPSPEPDVPKDFIALPFLAPGAPDKARVMQLEVIARLPEGAKVLFDAPVEFLERAQVLTPAAKVLAKASRGRVPVNAAGRSKSRKLTFPAKARNELRLLVHIPKNARGRAYEIAVRQLHEGVEVGRVTWHLAPGVNKRQAEAKKKQK
ncbi:MAG: S8 family serine peptidase [Acidobacteriota bacterium]|nr:S8 family serine peptidase [Acidobacteriota bacterium]